MKDYFSQKLLAEISSKTPFLKILDLIFDFFDVVQESLSNTVWSLQCRRRCIGWLHRQHNQHQHYQWYRVLSQYEQRDSNNSIVPWSLQCRRLCIGWLHR